MFTSNVTRVILFMLSAFIRGSHNLDYSDLEALGISCPEQDRCEGYRNNLSYVYRSCECDAACATYKDCCIDVRRRPSSSRVQNRMRCINVGTSLHTGVYVVANCSSNWNGSPEIRQKCEGPDDFTDPLLAAPVTNVAQAVTYRNHYCAVCNNALGNSLKLFNLRMSCEGLQDLSDAQVFADITYSEQYDAWGVSRLNSDGNATNFYACDIIFDAPSYLNRSMRFCRANLISTCSPTWARHSVRRNCEEYMAAVYDNEVAYRNPHCAICNHKSVDEISCTSQLFSRKRPMSFALLLDVNQSDGDQVGMTRVPTPECPSNHIYDPFFKRCKQLACAIPGHELVDGRCVRS